MTKRVLILPLKHSKPQRTEISVHQSELISKMFPTHCAQKRNETVCHLTAAISKLVNQRENTYPVLLRSIRDGKKARRYVHVQISSKMTDNKL